MIFCKGSNSLLYAWNFPGENPGVDSHSLLQEIFRTQGLNPDLPHCRQTLNRLSHQGSPYSEITNGYFYFFYIYGNIRRANFVLDKSY